MADKNEQTMKAALQAFFKRNGLQHKIDETRLIQLWPEIVGEFIARYTKELQVNGSCLTIRVDSSVIKQQLMISKDTVIQNINRNYDREYISDIKVLQ